MAQDYPSRSTILAARLGKCTPCAQLQAHAAGTARARPPVHTCHMLMSRRGNACALQQHAACRVLATARRACWHVQQDMSAEEASALEQLVDQTSQQLDAVQTWCLARSDCQQAVRSLPPPWLVWLLKRMHGTGSRQDYQSTGLSAVLQPLPPRARSICAPPLRTSRCRVL